MANEASAKSCAERRSNADLNCRYDLRPLKAGVASPDQGIQVSRISAEKVPDGEGAAHVRHDKRESPTHFVIGEALIEPTKYPEASATDPRLLKVRHQGVYKSLRRDPLLGESRATKFIARNTLRNRSVHCSQPKNIVVGKNGLILQ